MRAGAAREACLINFWKGNVNEVDRKPHHIAGYLDVWIKDPLVLENPFIGLQPEPSALPSFEAARNLLPDPHWEGHAAAIACYWKTWELAFQNIRQPNPGNGFIVNYIDTAFNDCLFMWDSALSVSANIPLRLDLRWRGNRELLHVPG
jgi:hypothetical protein